ncbi:hypothetical protein SAMN05444161_6612 [Rhizobiales bacterium GAS191]|jgi:hypothetical protein|nr:hypothetical protein SAMN05444161_6612 [Rhizobiales bacterium GAS191]
MPQAILAPIRYARYALGFDARILARDYWMILQGKHRRAIRERKGTCTLPIRLTRAVIVATYPQGSEIFSTVNLLDALVANGFYVIVVSSRELDEHLSAELLPHCHCLLERHNIGHDFGAYKFGLEWFQRQDFLGRVEVLGLANDSMFYPKRFAEELGTLLSCEHPWMGLYESFVWHHHVQSFLQLFRREVFDAPCFKSFWSRYRPLSLRRHAIHKGEIGLSGCLQAAGYASSVLYTTSRLRGDLMRRLGQGKNEDLPLHRILRLSLNDDYFAALATAAQSNLTPGFVVEELVSRVVRQGELHNPTHGVGLLCNYLYGAPLKRDLCYRGTHTIADLVALSHEFDEAEKAKILSDLRRKGLYVSLMTKRQRHLFDTSRI